MFPVSQSLLKLNIHCKFSLFLKLCYDSMKNLICPLCSCVSICEMWVMLLVSIMLINVFLKTALRFAFHVYYLHTLIHSLVAQLVKNLTAMQETWVRSLVQKIPWRRERLPTPVFWPGEFHGVYSPWGRKESDMTEWLSVSYIFCIIAIIIRKKLCTKLCIIFSS